MNVRMFVAVGFIAVCAVWVLSFASAADDPAPAEKLPDFSGKVLLVYLSREPTYPAYIMVDSQLREIGKRLFLSGKFADTRRREDWRTGFETNIAWDAVTTYQVLTPEAYEKFLDDAQAVH